MSTEPLSVCALVPTYRRPSDLLRCIEALGRQQRPADEILIVVRDDDAETWAALNGVDAAALHLRPVTVSVPGQVQALNAGIACARSDIIAITDDDAAPHADWLRRIVAHFTAYPQLGGVGGRDHMRINNVLQEGRRTVVGKVPAVGKHVGEHHLGHGPAREVDVLKGVNGAYRASVLKAIGLDTRLRGTGAQVHWEIGLGIAVKRAGWKLLYDPAVAVDHYLAPRFDEDLRNAFNPLATKNMVFNETLLRIEHLPFGMRLLHLAWCVLVGTRVAPGIVQWFRFYPRERTLATAKLRATLSGRLDAWQWNEDHLRCKR